MGAGPLSDVLSSPSVWELTVLLVVLPIALALVIEFALFKLLARRISEERTYLRLLVENVRVPVLTTVLLLGCTVIYSVPGIADAVYFSESQIERFVGDPAITVIVVIWAFYLNRLSNVVVAELDVDEDEKFDAAPLVSNVASVGILLGSIGLLLSVWEYDVTPLLGAAGILGIVIGFAARETLADFLGGLALYFDDTYRVGDFLELDSGVQGSVIDVGIRSTTLRTKDNVEVNVPNSVLSNSRVTNKSAPNEDIRIGITVGVAYGTDVDELEALLLGIAEAEELVLSNPTPTARFVEFGDSAIVWELLVWVRSPLQIPVVKDRLNTEIYKQLEAAGIEIPYPTRDVNVGG